MPMPVSVRFSSLHTLILACGTLARKVSTDFPGDFYFRQLTPGTDFALSRSPVHLTARQMKNYVYVLGDKHTGDAIVIDGAWDPDGIANLVAADNMTLVSHIATHFHWDHVGGSSHGMVIPGIKDWAERGLPIHISSVELDAAAAQTSTDASLLSAVSDGQCMGIGRFGLEFIATPGHSMGSMCIRVTEGVGQTSTPSAHGTVADAAADQISTESESIDLTDLLLITGDTVFPGSCGRLDLPESDAKVMYDSLQKLSQLPPELPIFPGHGYSGASSTIGQEKSQGLLRDMTRAQWNSMMT